MRQQGHGADFAYDCTIAECLDHVVAERKLADKRVRSIAVAFNETRSVVDATRATFARMVALADPFTSGLHMTLPAWYVQRQLAYVGMCGEIADFDMSDATA